MAISVVKEVGGSTLLDVDKVRLEKNLTSKIAILESEIEEKQKRVDGLSVEVTNLIAEKERIEKETADALKNGVNVKKKVAGKYSVENVKVIEKLTKSKQDIIDGNSVLEGLKEDIVTKTTEAQTLKDTIAKEKVLEQSIVTSTNEKKTELETLNAQIVEKSSSKSRLAEDIITLTSQKEELSKITSGKLEKEGIVTTLNTEISTLEGVKTAKETELADLDTKIEVSKAEGLEIDKNNKERDERSQAREGVNSLKESWLLDKEETLKATKTELEKHYNRPLNNVII